MHESKNGQPPSQDAPDEKPLAPAAPTPVVIWVNDEAVCVTIVDTPPHVPCGACQCGACRAHAPEEAVRFL